MGYYLRFFDEEPKPLTIVDLEAGLKTVDAAFRFEQDGDLFRGDQLLAEVEINVPGEGVFEGELDEFLESIEAAGVDDPKGVRDRISRARAIIALRVLRQARTSEATSELLQPAIDWIAGSRSGLFQVDGEGFYDGEELLLELG